MGTMFPVSTFRKIEFVFVRVYCNSGYYVVPLVGNELDRNACHSDRIVYWGNKEKRDKHKWGKQKLRGLKT